MASPIKCSACGTDLQFWEEKCSLCGIQHSFPNVRKAEGERTALLQLYAIAVQDSLKRGIQSKTTALEAAANNGHIVVNMPLDVIYNLMKDARNNYVSYYRLVDAGVRKTALEQHQVNRSVADDALFPYYSEHIVYGALSCNGTGLDNYGAVSVFLKDAVAPLRTSLLIENSFRFCEHYYKYGQPLPDGYRASWSDRGLLAVVKHEPQLSKGTPNADIPGLLLRSNADRSLDDFIEAHIYDGFDKNGIESIALRGHLSTLSDQHRWGEITELLNAERLEFGVGVKT